MARRRLHIVVAVLAVALTACRPPSNDPKKYNAETKRNFVESCVATGSSDDTCRCVYQFLVDNVPFKDDDEDNKGTDDFLEIEAALEKDPKKVPETLDKQVQRCSTGPVSPTTEGGAAGTTTSTTGGTGSTGASTTAGVTGSTTLATSTTSAGTAGSTTSAPVPPSGVTTSTVP